MAKPKLSRILIIFAFCIATATALPAQTFTDLLNFDGTDGSTPVSALVQGTDGNFYGTTLYGGESEGNCGTYGCGTVFKITRCGKLTTLHRFIFSDGSFPEAELVQAANENFYSTTGSGEDNYNGTVFEMAPSGALTTLHQFNYTDGSEPFAGLIEDESGRSHDFYGTTYLGGDSIYGTVFRITSEGALTTMHSFNNSDGDDPATTLVQGTDGDFYGTTVFGGPIENCSIGCGTVFKITPDGTFTTLHLFEGLDGKEPSGLTLGADGNFYGTTYDGGAYGNGTVFRMTPTGTITTLHSFVDAMSGYHPVAGLVQATDGNFYGTTFSGGTGSCSPFGCGTIFKISPWGRLTLIHNFSPAEGGSPNGNLIQATDGNLYGTAAAYWSGHNCQLNCGSVFRLSVGLGPFVKTRPTSGEVGTRVTILGNNLKCVTSVTFDGTSAPLLKVTDSSIETAVPPGAATGTVEVTTVRDTLKSNVEFRVRP